MADERIVSKKLEQVEQYHGELRAKQRSLSRDIFLTNVTEQRAVERMFENVIQATADLAKHIASSDFDYQGDESKEAIRVLHHEDVIDEATVDTLIAAVGFRNVLAHEYGDVDYDIVFDILQSELDVYNQFSQQIARWLQTGT